MAYIKNEIDSKNINWFENNFSVFTLYSIELIGKIRGLQNLTINFKYPITAISGKNGSGKSTVLAIACCAYHNDAKYAFNPKKRKIPYYTFSDFFIQTSDEIPPDGISISYSVGYPRWITKDGNEFAGKGNKIQEKSQGGRWTNYDSRIKRDVIFFGLERVVPHAEKSVSKTYRKAFSDKEVTGIEKKAADIAGYILDKTYDSFKVKTHKSYQIPLVRSQDNTYSGFNMGAGENAVFDIITTILAAPKGTLFVIDEIELGLHDQAQHRLIQKLKELCLEKHIQIICTTHSGKILSSLPPRGKAIY